MIAMQKNESMHCNASNRTAEARTTLFTSIATARTASDLTDIVSCSSTSPRFEPSIANPEVPKTKRLTTGIGDVAEVLDKKIVNPKSANTTTGGILKCLSLERKQALSEKARVEVDKKFAKFLPRHKFALYRLDHFPKFDTKELCLGEKLGQGQFGVIKEIRDVHLLQNNDDPEEKSSESSDEELRMFIKTYCLRDDPGSKNDASKQHDLAKARYAIKQPKMITSNNVKQFYSSVKDMTTEAYLLAALEHPFILKLRAVSAAPVGSEDFFVVVDRLTGTLDDKLNKEWREAQYKLSKKKRIAAAFSSLSKGYKQDKIERRRAFLEERLAVAKNLTSAVHYLHKNHIMDRDLKPENVGFDVHGDVKLFDFGLSTVFDPFEKGENQRDPKKQHTARTGSLLYMAPENFLGKSYDETVDIYALGYILWQILYLDEPFPVQYRNWKMHEQHVIRGGLRPELEDNHKEDVLLLSDGRHISQLPELLNKMWHNEPQERPSAKTVYYILTKETDYIKSLAERGLKADERKSRLSLKRQSDLNQRRSSCLQERFMTASLLAAEVLMFFHSDKDL